MGFRALTLENLEHLDFGKVDVAFQQHIKRVALDCLDRPVDDKARIVTMKVSVKPVPETDGTCDHVALQIKLSSSVPDHKTKVYDLLVKRSGQLLFSEDSPENAAQSTIFDDEKD